MAKAKKKEHKWSLVKLIFTAASTVVAIVVLALSSLTIVNIYNNDYSIAPKYLPWIFMCLAIMSILMFLQNRTKANLLKCIFLIVFDIGLGVVIVFAKDNPYLFSLTAGLFCVTVGIARVFSIIQRPTPRNIILNALVIAFVVALGIGLFTSTSQETDAIQHVVLLECSFIAVVAFFQAMCVALYQLKFKILLKILISTFALEILVGLLIIVVCFSLVFTSVEPQMPDFATSLWYCFAVVTTIGFGDIVAVTPIGRILTVILGFYGLIVVAVITSIIVNLYNEMNGKHDQKELKEISEEEKNSK